MEELIEIKTINSYEKGIGLEKAFCNFLKSDLGFSNARIRAQMKSRLNNRGSNVDVIAERSDVRGKRLRMLGVFYLILCALVLYYGFTENNQDLLYLGVFLEVAGIIAIIISKKLNVEYVWVECKNQKTKVSYAQMQKTIHEYDEYKALKDKEYKFVDQYFVSSSGFVENALKLARDRGVTCFVSDNDSFSEVSYWNDKS